ncbi:hypothetical protein LOK49_LG07G01238 [Camellia lanceoleosa]|uniref:Uncharacterized protein n=1 Tax=Camellia lanceoleosa TaxID=1840588 RepID=A0ACC0H436_9ERIC|nr:hypothetical protein LOK49_LG07G01238 [Camellia lanceoleosa]
MLEPNLLPFLDLKMTMNELRGNCWVVFFWKQAALTMSFMVYAVKLSKTKNPNWVALLWLSDSEPYWSFVLVTWLFGFAHLWSFKISMPQWKMNRNLFTVLNVMNAVGMTGNDGLYDEQEIRRKLVDDGPTLLMMINFFCFLFFVFGKGDLVKGAAFPGYCWW